ncbi:MAG: metal-dependent hydrolase, partial [Acidobacteriaceae bacterium]
MGRAGLNRKTALATLTLTLAAEAPDIDVVGNFKDPVFGFAHHRGFTHSFLGLFFVSALVVGFVYLIWRVRGKKLKDPALPPRWVVLFGFAYLAGVVHILLDFTNNYGVRPFWPFNEKWYSWDIVFIVEPAILIFLVGGLLLPVFFRSAVTKRLAAALALACMALLWGVRDFEHRRAMGVLESRYHDVSGLVRASAYPY